MYVCMYVCMYIYMYVCTYVCMYVRMYVCMYVCVCVRSNLPPHTLESQKRDTNVTSHGHIYGALCRNWYM